MINLRRDWGKLLAAGVLVFMTAGGIHKQLYPLASPTSDQDKRGGQPKSAPSLDSSKVADLNAPKQYSLEKINSLTTVDDYRNLDTVIRGNIKAEGGPYQQLKNVYLLKLTGMGYLPSVEAIASMPKSDQDKYRRMRDVFRDQFRTDSNKIDVSWATLLQSSINSAKDAIR